MSVWNKWVCCNLAIKKAHRPLSMSGLYVEQRCSLMMSKMYQQCPHNSCCSPPWSLTNKWVAETKTITFILVVKSLGLGSPKAITLSRKLSQTHQWFRPGRPVSRLPWHDQNQCQCYSHSLEQGKLFKCGVIWKETPDIKITSMKWNHSVDEIFYTDA